MPNSLTLTLDDQQTRFITEQVAQGTFADANDVVRAALNRLAGEEAIITLLRDAVIEGEQSGISSRSVMDIFSQQEQEFKMNG